MLFLGYLVIQTFVIQTLAIDWPDNGPYHKYMCNAASSTYKINDVAFDHTHYGISGNPSSSPEEFTRISTELQQKCMEDCKTRDFCVAINVNEVPKCTMFSKCYPMVKNTENFYLLPRYEFNEGPLFQTRLGHTCDNAISTQIDSYVSSDYQTCATKCFENNKCESFVYTAAFGCYLYSDCTMLSTDKGDTLGLMILPRPTDAPTNSPTKQPTKNPTKNPTKTPTKTPTKNPTKTPTKQPTKQPTNNPTKSPTKEPTVLPGSPSRSPTLPTMKPTQSPTVHPTTKQPTTKSPTTAQPSSSPTASPIITLPVSTPKPTSANQQITSKPTAEPELNFWDYFTYILYGLAGVLAIVIGYKLWKKRKIKNNKGKYNLLSDEDAQKLDIH